MLRQQQKLSIDEDAVHVYDYNNNNFIHNKIPILVHNEYITLYKKTKSIKSQNR